MTGLLTWRPAVRSDRKALNAFQCTERSRSVKLWHGWEKQHQRPWERQVQARIHQASPPYPPPEFLLVGVDSDGLGGVAFYEELDGPHQIEIHFAAVAMRFRRRGGGWADEMLNAVFDAITTRALETGADLVEISTWIHEANRPSQRMARDVGMRQVAATQLEGHLQRWAVILLVGGAELPR